MKTKLTTRFVAGALALAAPALAIAECKTWENAPPPSDEVRAFVLKSKASKASTFNVDVSGRETIIEKTENTTTDLSIERHEDMMVASADVEEMSNGDGWKVCVRI